MINNTIKCINNKIYIDCFFYGFYINKNDLIKYKNRKNELIINNLINNHMFNNLSNVLKDLSC
jgi:hypothetical protein